MQIRNTADQYYDPKNVTLLLGGVEPVEIAEDTAYVVSKNQDVILPKTGVDGSVALAINRDETGTLTISLKNTSITNRSLINFYRAQETGVPWFPVSFTDPSSGISLETQGWIQTQPDFTIAQEIMQLDWVIGLASSRFNQGQIEAQGTGTQIQSIFRGSIGDIDLSTAISGNI